MSTLSLFRQFQERLLSTSRKRTIIAMGLLVLASCPLAFPYSQPGYQIAHDRLVPYLRTAELVRVLSELQLPPRWFSNFDGGYGSPYPSFYAMGFYYIAAIFNIVGVSVGSSVETTAYLALLASGLSMFLLVRHIWGSFAGLAAGSLYLYAPYHLVDAYVRGALSELASFVWFPLILLALLRIQEARDVNTSRLGALSIGGLLITHNISAMIFLPAMLAVSILLIFQEQRRGGKSRRTLLGLLHAWITGGMLAGFLWIPILFDRRFIRTDYFLQFDFRGDFIPWRDLLSTASTHTLTFELGIIHLVAAALSVLIVAVWRSRKPHKPVMFVSLLIFLAYIYMTNHRSEVVWEAVPFIEFTQFPWRMLGPASFFLTLLAVSAYSAVRGQALRLIIALGLSVAAIYLHKPLLDTPRRAAEIRTSPAQTCQEVWGTQDYRPRWSRTQFWRSTEPPAALLRTDVLSPCPDGIQVVSRGEIELLNEVRHSNQWKITYRADRPSTITIPQFYYPGWFANLDGEPVHIDIQDPSGMMRVKSPSGSHELVLKYTGTVAENAGNIVSLVGILLLNLPLVQIRELLARN